MYREAPFPSEPPLHCSHQKHVSPRRPTSSSARLPLSHQILIKYRTRALSLSLSLSLCVCVMCVGLWQMCIYIYIYIYADTLNVIHSLLPFLEPIHLALFIVYRPSEVIFIVQYIISLFFRKCIVSVQTGTHLYILAHQLLFLKTVCKC